MDGSRAALGGFPRPRALYGSLGGYSIYCAFTTEERLAVETQRFQPSSYDFDSSFFYELICRYQIEGVENMWTHSVASLGSVPFLNLQGCEFFSVLIGTSGGQTLDSSWSDRVCRRSGGVWRFHQHTGTDDLKSCMSCTYQRRVITVRNPDTVQRVC